MRFEEFNDPYIFSEVPEELREGFEGSQKMRDMYFTLYKGKELKRKLKRANKAHIERRKALWKVWKPELTKKSQVRKKYTRLLSARRKTERNNEQDYSWRSWQKRLWKAQGMDGTPLQLCPDDSMIHDFPVYMRSYKRINKNEAEVSEMILTSTKNFQLDLARLKTHVI